jgi:hypothetical protein
MTVARAVAVLDRVRDCGVLIEKGVPRVWLDERISDGVWVEIALLDDRSIDDQLRQLHENLAMVGWAVANILRRDREARRQSSLGSQPLPPDMKGWA